MKIIQKAIMPNGIEKLQDLSRHFWNGEKDMFYLGMIEAVN